MKKLNVNGVDFEIDVPDDVPLLWVIREEIGLTGTKFGCGAALCGVCTVHVDGEPKRSCVTPVGEVWDLPITTIEGVTDVALAVQKAWIEENVAQCGYCQPGQIMSAAALLKKRPKPSDEDIDAVLSANLCRCGTYQRIRKAVHRAARDLAGAPAPAPAGSVAPTAPEKSASPPGAPKTKDP